MPDWKPAEIPAGSIIYCQSGRGPGPSQIRPCRTGVGPLGPEESLRPAEPWPPPPPPHPPHPGAGPGIHQIGFGWPNRVKRSTQRSFPRTSLGLWLWRWRRGCLGRGCGGSGAGRNWRRSRRRDLRLGRNGSLCHTLRHTTECENYNMHYREQPKDPDTNEAGTNLETQQNTSTIFVECRTSDVSPRCGAKPSV